MSRSRKPSEAAEVATRILVSHDIGFLIALLGTLEERQETGDEGATWLSMTYLDWAALAVYEIRDLGRKGTAIAGADAALAFEDQLAESRHSTKLLDDTKKSVEQLLYAFRNYSEQHRDQLINMTRAPSAIRNIPWLGRLQDDTSVVLCGGEVLATTLSIRHHLGLEMNSDPATVQARGYEIGSFLGSVSDDASAEWAAKTVAAGLSFPPVRAMDTSYREFFGSTFAGTPPSESMALSITACRLRAALTLGAAARRAGDIPTLLSLKFRLAVTWQVAATLRTIADNPASFELDDDLADDLQHMQTSQAVAAMNDRGLRNLRNVLVHYGLRDHDAANLDWDDPLLGLPQMMWHKRGWREVEAVIDQAGMELIEMLDRWRGPVDQLLREPL